MPAAVYADDVTCTCGGPAKRTVIRTTVPGAKPAAVIDCPQCDRSKCQRCKKQVHDQRTRTCPACGAALQFTV